MARRRAKLEGLQALAAQFDVVHGLHALIAAFDDAAEKALAGPRSPSRTFSARAPRAPCRRR